MFTLVWYLQEKEYKKKVLVGPKTNKYKPPKKYSGKLTSATVEDPKLSKLPNLTYPSVIGYVLIWGYTFICTGSVLIARPSRPQIKNAKRRKRSASASPTMVCSAPSKITFHIWMINKDKHYINFKTIFYLLTNYNCILPHLQRVSMIMRYSRGWLKNFRTFIWHQKHFRICGRRVPGK